MKMKALRLFLLVTGLLSTVMCCNSQEKYNPLFNCSNRLNNPYGICTHINRTGERYEFDTRYKDLYMIDKAGANIIRTDFDRSVIQDATKGAFDFRHFDSVLYSVRHQKKMTLGILTQGNEPAFSQSWKTYVYETVKRYKKTRYWELINEIDIAHYWIPGFKTPNYQTFLKEGYLAVKKANPRAKVLFSGLSSITEGKIDLLITNDNEPYFDIMNVHKYANSQSDPESFIKYYHTLSKLMRKAEIEKPVWLTETGASTSIRNGVSEEQQAIWLPRIYLISFACGVDKVFWYKSRSRELDANALEDNFGLWHKDYTPKPAYYSYQFLTKMCPHHSIRPQLTRYGDIFLASWRRPDRTKVWAIWCRKGDSSINFESRGKFTIYDMNGHIISITGEKLKVSSSVIYIVGAKDFQIN